MDVLPMEALGERIMVCGPSNAGKSTLAVTLANKLSSQPVHLDLLRHLPNTDWVERSDDEFRALHDEVILSERWVIEGNFNRLMPQRFARATGIVLLGDNRFANLQRYLWRTLFQTHGRVGALTGNRDNVKWEMVRWILIRQPKLRQQDIKRPRSAGLPMIQFNSMAELNQLYRAWGLER